MNKFTFQKIEWKIKQHLRRRCEATSHFVIDKGHLKFVRCKFKEGHLGDHSALGVINGQAHVFIWGGWGDAGSAMGGGLRYPLHGWPKVYLEAQYRIEKFLKNVLGVLFSAIPPYD